MEFLMGIIIGFVLGNIIGIIIMVLYLLNTKEEEWEPIYVIYVKENLIITEIN